MNWLFGEATDQSHLMVLIFEIANWISGAILMLTTVVLIYFLKQKKRDQSDGVFCVVTSAIFLLGIKKLITIWLLDWAAFPAYCTFVDAGIALALMILIWFLPPLVLRLLAAVSREELLIDLIRETKSKITAQDSAASLGIRNSELQALVFKFDTILNIQHRLGNQTEMAAQLRNVISASGESHHGD